MDNYLERHAKKMQQREDWKKEKKEYFKDCLHWTIGSLGFTVIGCVAIFFPLQAILLFIFWVCVLD